jgi:hypothetical protein
MASNAPLPPVDHLVWGGKDLEEEIDRLEGWTGVRAVFGGRHPDEGTHNALLRLGPAMYLELIAPDPAQAPPGRPRWFGLDSLTSPRLVTWAIKSTALEQTADAARIGGLHLGAVRDGRRESSSGQVLSWRLTYPDMRTGSGLVPFLIDWHTGAHPARAAPGGIELVGLRGEHPEPAAVAGWLRQLGGLHLPLVAGETPMLIATLDTPRGRIELR